MFNGRAGVGDGELLTISEQDVKTLLSFRDATGQVVVTRVSGVNEFSSGTANMGYQLEYLFEYTYTESSQ